MKALTVRQPHAEKIARGDKPIENRTWATLYRGPLAIHAGKSTEEIEDWDAVDERVNGFGRAEMALGAFVAIAELVDCVRLADLPAHLRDNEHAEGPVCWVLAHVRRLPRPIPYRGAQGLFDVDDAVVSMAVPS